MALHLWKPARLTNPEMKKRPVLHGIYFKEGLAQSKMEEEFRGLIRMVTLLSEKEPLATNHQNPALSAPCQGRALFHYLHRTVSRNGEGNRENSQKSTCPNATNFYVKERQEIFK